MQIESNGEVQGNDNIQDNEVNVEVTVIQKELETLRATHSDLEAKYNTLNTEYSQYKFDIEFSRDISSIKHKLNEDEVETLKLLKSSGNDKAYNMMLKSYSKYLAGTGGIGNWGRGLNPAEQQETQTKTNTDAFTQAIKQKKESR